MSKYCVLHSVIAALCRMLHSASGMIGHVITVEAMGRPGSHINIGWPRDLSKHNHKHASPGAGSHVSVRAHTPLDPPYMTAHWFTGVITYVLDLLENTRAVQGACLAACFAL